MNDTCLSYHRSDPDHNEDDVSVDSFENVTLSVDFPGVNLIKQRHHDERVEDNREMLVGGFRGPVVGVHSSIIDVEPHISYKSWKNKIFIDWNISHAIVKQ